MLLIDGEMSEHPKRRLPVLFSFKLFPADITFMEFQYTPAQMVQVRLCFVQNLQTWRKRCAAFIEWYNSASSTIIALQARHAANLSQLVVRAGEAAAHCVSTNQQQEVIPADGCGPVGVIMRCAE